MKSHSRTSGCTPDKIKIFFNPVVLVFIGVSIEFPIISGWNETVSLGPSQMNIKQLDYELEISNS